MMEEQDYKQKRLFKNLLEKMYEKGEMEKEVSTKDIIQDMEVELRSILSAK
ncbi:hypothetical protein JMM81_06665 [Bacillus sp. V3B]|uniref:hypothetical protein n=1 Tax=Bacillus sp. V3B TaxID=2804915 RepID=UPI00210CA6C3|nr:hypothetical protein [Bacillus sp. V3B]MCQ6274656.1 hypothetical protein [Bacillus sp. V3B]